MKNSGHKLQEPSAKKTLVTVIGEHQSEAIKNNT